MAGIELRSVKKRFGDVEVIPGANLSIKDNEFVVFVGPSGCGKSTLLRLLAGLEDLTDGAIEIDGDRVDHLPPSKRGLAMVFQTYALYPHMTVYQNMSYALKVAKAPKAEIDQKVRQAAEILQLTDYLDRKPKALSGGQRQRVAIGRAIVRNPKVFLFDEPLSNLDAKLRVQMRIEITKLHKRLNATMIYVTHDQVEAMTMADKIVVLKDGVIEQVGPPLELYKKPNNRFVAGFIGSPAMNFFPAEIMSKTDSGVTLKLEGCDDPIPFPCSDPSSLTSGDKVTFGVRPEHAVLEGQSDGQVSGEVYAVERLGGETYLYAMSATGQDITVHAPGDQEFDVGETIKIGFLIEDCHLFDSNDNAVR
ncbi:Lactose transport ATP-binding protein lacK [Vibrio nigripulchritudo SO65]|uniref:ABC transporter ATP-binding protein n=1 Tax=Vibrio nigripulchritudo TaxID=28173 RepID=UPI0003B22520|nr:sn-glycerol-3-phosphate ABC transporter ATP-binding protein UgpC [Vibrio nigripulchritudo]CCN38482.1 Lactose transport ATP-binding protein lacK [Vibrio nigripulchritudo AM115]CCN44230.1 Lactose transport ATP-binding protein lacK [Vibrio nigripulchritudo FTn2]CCN67714.1 Lactose transport ATP-binding protein lacK [Vibrio nigripulchritudo POn4]CCN76037.1 Lactose transport ATP-binding protein lacK [Vibrio nigripulchritudo SO65]